MAHYFTDNRNLQENRKEHSFRFSGHLYTFITDNGVFSKTGVDRGTEILLEAIYKELRPGDTLDLGCGYGVVSVVAGSLVPGARMSAVDINPRAVELTELNCAANHVGCNAYVSDGFSAVNGNFIQIITNPPIRAGKQVIYAMFTDAYSHLKEGGSFYAVIRRKQGAESAVKKLTEIFGRCDVIERESGYWVLKCTKLTG